MYILLYDHKTDWCKNWPVEPLRRNMLRTLTECYHFHPLSLATVGEQSTGVCTVRASRATLSLHTRYDVENTTLNRNKRLKRQCAVITLTMSPDRTRLSDAT